MTSRSVAFIGAVILVALLCAAALAPVLAPYNTTQQNLENDLAASSRDHLLGTDKLGRDLLSRILYGSRVSLSVGITTVTVSILIGLLVGSLSGYFGGWVDQLFIDRKSTRLNSSHIQKSRMPSSA